MEQTEIGAAPTGDDFLGGMETPKDSDDRIQTIKEINDLRYELKIPEERFESYLQNTFGANNIDDLTDPELKKVLGYIKSFKAKREAKEATQKGEVAETPAFTFVEGENGILKCINGEKGTEYELDLNKPSCTCLDFKTHKAKSEFCKHLQAAKDAGYDVKEFPVVPEDAKDAIIQARRGNNGKGKKKEEEDSITLSYNAVTVTMPVQTPTNIIEKEEVAATAIKDILGNAPLKANVIESFGANIEEIAADVVISLAQHSGIRFTVVSKDVKTAKLNLGEIYKTVEEGRGDNQKRNAEMYAKLAAAMPDTDVTISCKVTAIAAWRDNKGGLRVGTGTKEEHLTVYSLKDLASRGVNFVETSAETKAFKKAIINALPITHDGLLQKIKQTYGWD